MHFCVYDAVAPSQLATKLRKKAIMYASFFTAIAATAAMVASFVAYFQMRAANKSNTASVFLHFSSKYDQPEITIAIRDLLAWRRSKGTDFAAEWFKAFEARDKNANDINQARRLINRYFDEIVRTYESGLIDDKLVRALTARFGLLLYYDIIVPMNHEMFGKKYLDRSKTLRNLSAHYNGSTSLDVEL